MSLEKAIKSGKEHRKPYYGCKAIDKTCRNHGSDDWMKENRLYSTTKRKAKAAYREDDEQISEYDRTLQLRAEYVNHYYALQQALLDCEDMIKQLSKRIAELTKK